MDIDTLIAIYMERCEYEFDLAIDCEHDRMAGELEPLNEVRYEQVASLVEAIDLALNGLDDESDDETWVWDDYDERYEDAYMDLIAWDLDPSSTADWGAPTTTKVDSVTAYRVVLETRTGRPITEMWFSDDEAAWAQSERWFDQGAEGVRFFGGKRIVLTDPTK